MTPIKYRERLRADYLTEPPFDFPHCPDTLRGQVSAISILTDLEMNVKPATMLESLE